VRLHHSLLDQPEIGLSFAWDKAAEHLDLELRGVMAAGGETQIVGHWDPQRWEIEVGGHGLAPAALKAALEALNVGVPPWQLAGRLDLEIELTGAGAQPESAVWDAALQGFGFSGPEGNYVGEGLNGAWTGELRFSTDTWRGSTAVTLDGGELLTPGFYLAAHPQRVSVSGTIGYRVRQQLLRLDDVRYRHESLFEIHAQAELSLQGGEPLRRLEVHSPSIPVDALYRRYLQPVLPGGVIAGLETAGNVGVDLDYRAGGASRLELDLEGIHVDGAQTPEAGDSETPELRPVRPFGLYGLNGHLVWSSGSASQVSELSWVGGHILEVLDLGGASVRLRMGRRGLELENETTIPILDGSLLVVDFSLAWGEGDSRRVSFDGVLTPVSMQAISAALGWPSLSGKLSGVIPSVSFSDGVLTVDGNLLVRVFDGEVLVRNLRVEDLFGIWPIVAADVELRNLDLEALTEAFAFGKITGRIEGRIKGLRLENWTPVAFDARFATPESDRSPHRISQRAVDNISDLGGAGVSGALSRSFLRYFDEFGYKRLGISCQLRDGVCEMGGVAPADQGYYLVEGGGIPRIGIVGHTRRIDWNRLVSQLKEIAAGNAGTPVVQ
jgi:hypothetical protein